MRKQLKSRADLFDYLIHGYVFELEDVPTKTGIQKRLRDNELEQELKEKNKRKCRSRRSKCRVKTRTILQ